MRRRTAEAIHRQHVLICKVPCRHCGQPAHSPCRTPAGLYATPHASRRDDAAAAGVWVPGGTAEAREEP